MDGWLTPSFSPPRRQQMIIQNRELEELQQRIREAEERLKARESIVPESSSKNAGQRDGESRSAGEIRSVYISEIGGHGF